MSKIVLKNHKLTGKIYHPESTLVVKSVADKRTVIGRLENNQFVGIDEKTKELTKEYESEFKFKLDVVSSSEEEEEETEHNAPSHEASPKTHPKTPPTSPVAATPLIKPNVILHSSTEEMPEMVLETQHPTNFLTRFESDFQNYVERVKEEINDLESRKKKLLSQVETLQKQINVIRSAFLE